MSSPPSSRPRWGGRWPISSGIKRWPGSASKARPGVAAKLGEFGGVLDGARAALPALAALTDIEAATYAGGRFSTYYSERGLITVFIDSTERSPTFRLFPLDTVREPQRKCWIQVWTQAKAAEEAWRAFLGRPFRGLASEMYRGPFETGIDDPFLRRAALESLKKAGDDQAASTIFLYRTRTCGERGPKKRRPLRPGRPDARGSRVRTRRVVVQEGPATRRGERRQRGCPPDDRPCSKGFPADRSGYPACVRGAGRQARRRARPCPGFGRSFRPPPADRGQDAPQRPLDGRHGQARQGRRQHHDQRQPEQPQARRPGDLSHPVRTSTTSWAGAVGSRRYGARGPILRRGQRRPLRLHRLLQDRQAEAGQTAEVALSIVRILESLRQKRGVSREETLEVVRPSA